MPVIHFLQPDGSTNRVKAPLGGTVMDAATSNLVRGIVGECGGCCACATCHVYVHADWLARVGAPSNDERDMLAAAENPQTNSRLGCQITITADLDGLVLHIPEAS